MKIVGKVETKGFMRVTDLDDGDVFFFLEENDPYIVGVDERNDDTYVINLKDGVVTNLNEAMWYDRPIEKLNAELVIK